MNIIKRASVIILIILPLDLARIAADGCHEADCGPWPWFQRFFTIGLAASLVLMNLDIRKKESQ